MFGSFEQLSREVGQLLRARQGFSWEHRPFPTQDVFEIHSPFGGMPI